MTKLMLTNQRWAQGQRRSQKGSVRKIWSRKCYQIITIGEVVVGTDSSQKDITIQDLTLVQQSHLHLKRSTRGVFWKALRRSSPLTVLCCDRRYCFLSVDKCLDAAFHVIQSLIKGVLFCSAMMLQLFSNRIYLEHVIRQRAHPQICRLAGWGQHEPFTKYCILHHQKLEQAKPLCRPSS